MSETGFLPGGRFADSRADRGSRFADHQADPDSRFEDRSTFSPGGGPVVEDDRAANRDRTGARIAGAASGGVESAGAGSVDTRSASYRSTSEGLAADQFAAEVDTADRFLAEVDTADRFAAEVNTADRSAAERGPADRLAAERTATDRFAAAGNASDRLVAEESVTERAAAGTGSASVRPRRRRRFGVALAVCFSILALAGAVASGLLSWRTFEQMERIMPAPAAAISPPVADAEPTRPPEPERYPVSYAKEPLRLDLACATWIHLDLDEPRADVAETVADLRYESRCGTEPPKLTLGAGAAAGSRQVSADTDAAGCDRAIRTSPLGRGLQVEVKKGAALCVLTAADPAELVLVEIIDVGGSGTAGLRATSWQVPK